MQRENVRQDDAGDERGSSSACDELHSGAEVFGVGSSDFLLPELAHLLATAQKEITKHGNDRGLCSVCGSAFPCERAVLADLALSAL